MVKASKAGPAALAKMEEEPMELDLSKIRSNAPKERTKKGKKKPYSPEDIFMMESAQPGSHGGTIQVDYTLQTHTSYDTCCMCCGDTPAGVLPLTIVPLVNPECFGFQPPSGWMP